jgi:hypothetical protein
MANMEARLALLLVAQLNFDGGDEPLRRLELGGRGPERSQRRFHRGHGDRLHVEFNDRADDRGDCEIEWVHHLNKNVARGTAVIGLFAEVP